MSVWTVLGLGATATAGTAAAAAVVVIGAVGYFVILPQFQDEADDAQTEVVQQVAPEVVAPDPEPEPVVEAAPVEDAGPRPPTFDVVRVDGLGAALVAGIADAGKMIDVLLDGAAVVEASTGGDGRFVALFDIPPSDQPRSLQLSMRLEDGAVLSAETILIAPFALPVAEVEAEAPETTETASLEAEPEVTAPENLVTRAPAAPALVVATQDGVRVLQPSAAPIISAPDAPTIQVNVTIDTITYDAEGVVEIAGRGQGGGFVRLYLDNMAIKTTPVTEQGLWKGSLPGVAPGIYTLRVDELDSTGTVTSRFETPFKREEPAIVAAAQAALAPPAPVETVQPSVSTSASQPTVVTDDPTAPVVAADTSTPAITPEAGGDAQVASAPVLEPAARPNVNIITVQPGFTLWQIAEQMMGQGEMYVQVYEANRTQIRDPNLIYPGQVFSMPADQ